MPSASGRDQGAPPLLYQLVAVTAPDRQYVSVVPFRLLLISKTGG